MGNPHTVVRTQRCILYLADARYSTVYTVLTTNASVSEIVYLGKLGPNKLFKVIVFLRISFKTLPLCPKFLYIAKHGPLLRFVAAAACMAPLFPIGS